MADLSTWLTKAEAAGRLGISERGLERLIEKGEGPEVQYRPRSGNRPQPLYNPRDVENLAPKPRAQIMRAGDPRLARPGEPEQMAPARVVDLAPVAMAFKELALAIVNRIPVPPPPAPIVRPWLTPAEAAEYLGLSESLIRRLIRAGRLPYVRDGHSFKVSKASCDGIDAVAQLSELRTATAAIRETVAGRKAAGGRG